MALLSLAGVSGCSRPRAGAVPGDAVQRLRAADRATVTYFGVTGEVTKTLSTEETQSLVSAISTARKGDPARQCAKSLQITFFKGTNVISELAASHEHTDGFGFGFDGMMLLDTTGTLRAISAKFGEQPSPPH
jgi:hypothetical protein